jgi:hypothetical protein
LLAVDRLLYQVFVFARSLPKPTTLKAEGLGASAIAKAVKIDHASDYRALEE